MKPGPRCSKTTATQRQLLLALVLALALIATACGGSQRPTVSEWRDPWNEALAVIPDIGILTGEGAEAACGVGLAALRTLRGDLEPTPDAVLDDVVNEWANSAEAALFECPPTGDQSYEATFATMARLEAEVAAVLEIDSDG